MTAPLKGPISLRNLPPAALQIARNLSEQTRLSLADLLRQALVTGLLVEATRFAPDEQGRLGGLEPVVLARALRRHLGSAIDLLIEYGELPYALPPGSDVGGRGESAARSGETSITGEEASRRQRAIPALGEDLEELGMGLSLAASIRGQTLEP
ncbi:hypothetical protein [Thermogemmatispora sp.]|jgi:hypothetical protein|uniref:hypothetical protein n=1 Tax=Thermogemmatispora sp. TaxID=1968838 RepID=UPI0035E45618